MCHILEHTSAKLGETASFDQKEHKQALFKGKKQQKAHVLLKST